MNTKQLVPMAKTTELAVISLMIRHNDNRILLSDLTDNHFADLNCLQVFSAIRSLESSKTRVDITTIFDRLSQNKDNSITMEQLVKLKEYNAHSDNLSTYKEVLESKKVERDLANTGDSIKEICFRDIPLEDKIAQSISAITSLNYSVGEQTMTHEDAKNKLIAEIKKRKESTGTGLTWGLADLDEALHGINPDLITIAGMTGGGKTAFVVDVLMRNARNNHNCLFFSSEMNAEMIMYREIQKDLGISTGRLRAGEVSDYELEKISNYETSKNLWINDTSNLDVDKLVSIATLEHKKHGLDLIVVDYLQLLSTTKFKDQEVQQIGYISGQLKALSHKLNIPVIALVQYNKEVELREKPTKNYIYGSGKIVKDSGVVLLLHREDYFNKEIANNPAHSKNGLVEIIIDKNRYGAMKSVYARFIKERTTFVDLPPEEIPVFEGDLIKENPNGFKKKKMS